MSPSPSEEKPTTFGERFRERGLVGTLGKKKSPNKDPDKMHFLEHLEEMRWVILKSVIAFLLGCITVALFLDDSVRLLQRPLVSAVQDFGSLSIDLQSAGLTQYQSKLENQGVSLKSLINAKDEDLANWGIGDPEHRMRLLIHFAGGKDRNLLQVIRSYSPIFIAMKICFLGGLGISLPIILYFIGGFVIPGLTSHEKRIFMPGCLAATVLFLAGASMTYFFILPLSLAFTIEFSFNVLGLEIYRPEAGNYYSTVIWMTFAVGLAFQFPLVLILLIRIGALSVKKLKDSRRFVLVILMISAALITPGGDPVSLCILTIPLYFLFELSILVGILIEGRRKADKSSPNLFGSLLLLALLLLLAGGGGWIYLNWEKAEALFLSLDPKPQPSQQEVWTQNSTMSFSGNQTTPFILELSPLSPNESNTSLSPKKYLYQARIRSSTEE